MSTSYENTVIFSAPTAQLNPFANACAAATVRDMADFQLRAGHGASTAGPVTHRVGAGVLTDLEVDALRATLSPGGDLYALGCRARRLLNEATETTTGESGKAPVVVYGVGDTIPNDVDWTVSRVTKAFFLAEQSLVPVFSLF